VKAWLPCALLVAGLVAACGSGEPAAQNAGTPTQSEAPPGASAATVDLVQDKLIVTVRVDLEVNNLPERFSRITELTREFDGYVAESRLSGSGSDSAGSLKLRLPAPRYRDFLAKMRELPQTSVRREETNAREVTAEYTDLQARLSNLRAGEIQYRNLLASAISVDDVLKVSARLDEVRGQIELTQGRMNLIDDQSNLATIHVQLAMPSASLRSYLASPLDALTGAAGASFLIAWAALDAAVVLLVASVWLLPLAVLSTLAWRSGRRYLPALRQWFLS
jgi:hypothetical protein